jgi:hypothetical protein
MRAHFARERAGLVGARTQGGHQQPVAERHDHRVGPGAQMIDGS